jgi:phage-related protein
MLYLIAREYFVYNKSANEGAIKRSFSVNRYSGEKHAKPINLELAYDLLVTILFFKLCRDKIENKTSDNYLNKTILYVSLSLNIAPFIFSFITGDTELETIVRDRFKLMDKSGMFDSYKNNEFKTYGFDITEQEMIVAIGDLRTEYFESKSSMLDSYLRHVSLYNGSKCILNYDHPFNEEQIINQVVPFEMYVISTNKSLEDDGKDLMEYVTKEKLDTEVAEVFIKTVPKKNIPIVKFFEDHLTEIPENNRKDFMTNLETFNNRDYDLSDQKFPYDSFGEEGVKALFLWKPETGDKYTTYKKFYRAIVSSVHDKQTILSMISDDNIDNSSASFGEFYSNVMEKGK